MKKNDIKNESFLEEIIGNNRKKCSKKRKDQKFARTYSPLFPHKTVQNSLTFSKSGRYCNI